jgi:uncharacterized repeat protein (TIGR03943 family)
VVSLFAVATLCNRSVGRSTPFRQMSALSGMLLLLLPLLYFFNIGQGHFGEDALRKRSMPAGNNGVMPPSLPETTPTATTGRTTRLLIDDFQSLLNNPSSHINKEVTLVGMLLPDDKAPAGETFYCCRFRINCCAADAMPVGVMVWHQPPVRLNAGSWVRIEGTLRRLELPDTPKQLVVEADTVLPVMAPDSPYVL